MYSQLFQGLSGISVVFQVIRILLVNLGSGRFQIALNKIKDAIQIRK